MHLKRLQKRGGLVYACMLVGLFWISWPVVCLAQRSVSDNLRSRTMERLDKAEAAEMAQYLDLRKECFY